MNIRRGGNTINSATGTMLQVNQTIIDKKGNKGTITRIITKSTGYVEVSYENGITKKEMAFNLTDEKGNPLKKAPKKQEAKSVSPLQSVMNGIMSVNSLVRGDRNSLSYQIWEKDIAKIWMVAREQGNDFIKSVCGSCEQYMRVSEKQAYCLAKFAMDNNIVF